MAMKNRYVWMDVGKKVLKVMLNLMFIGHHLQRNANRRVRAGLLRQVDLKFFNGWCFGKFITICNVWSWKLLDCLPLSKSLAGSLPIAR
jgi:hypothetical protein